MYKVKDEGTANESTKNAQTHFPDAENLLIDYNPTNCVQYFWCTLS